MKQKALSHVDKSESNTTKNNDLFDNGVSQKDTASIYPFRDKTSYVYPKGISSAQNVENEAGNVERKPPQDSSNLFGYIPSVFKTISKPEILDSKACQQLPLSDRALAILNTGGKVKIFHLTNPVTGGQQVDDRYLEQYDLNGYDNNGNRIYNLRLDRDKKKLKT